MKKLVNSTNRPNKKAQDLSIGTLILIVLGIVVLVLLILGFTMGWENLWNKINIFGGTSSVADVATACRLALTSQDKYTLCEKIWDIKEGDNPKEKVGCRDSRVLSSLGKQPSDLGCTNTYNPLKKKCVPKTSSFCTSIQQPTAENCNGACKFTEAQVEPLAAEAKCELDENAATFCATKNDNEAECNGLVGCEFK
jgi:hypothetical protein